MTIGLFIILLIHPGYSFSQIAFKHHTIANPLPGASYGTGGFTVADYDKDGDPDVTVQRRSDNERVYWYENQNKNKWIPHIIGFAGGGQLGAASLDVNRDSFVDLVAGHAWFQNPGDLKIKPDAGWEKHLYNGDMLNENHDIVTADLNNDNVEDIIMYNQSVGTLRWYNISDPYNWTFTDIATDVNENNVHSGLFPGGVADIDNDGYMDAIMPLFWYKNPGETGKKWLKKAWPYLPKDPTPYGRGIRVWAGDINNDGFKEIIYSDCDVQFSKVYLLINVDGGETWKKEELTIPGSNVGQSGSLHSLQVADFDNDEDLDIFIGEQEDPDRLMKPAGLKERGIILQNIGNINHPRFLAVVIHEDNPGWHDALIGDIDLDGDLDIISKVWNSDGINYHLDFWENQNRPE